MRGVYRSEGSISNDVDDQSQLQGNKPGQYEVSSNKSTFWIFSSDTLLEGTNGLMVW